MKKRIIVSVTNDLVTDQRVAKVCSTLMSMDLEIVLVGRVLKNSLLISRPYKTKRFKLFFTKGALFYAEFNIRLFFYLLFHKADIYLSNDLDTLAANYLASVIKRKKIVFDSHEYYTETPELVNRKGVQKVWKTIEKYIFPKLKYVYTVNQSIASLFEKEYGNKNIGIIRNVSPKLKINNTKTRSELGLPDNKKIIILQGSGINIQRGSEEAVEAMQYVENAVFYIIGGGDVIEQLKQMVVELKLTDKVFFKPKQPFSELMQYTRNADLGLTLDKDTNINYRFSLPNKIFDYIQAGIPVLASDLPEVASIIKTYNVGDVIENHEPIHIAQKINEMLFDEAKRALWKVNIELAANELCWENEEIKLKAIYNNVIQ
jgi:glycosyltransferase involved in cell wall biosynthesis